VQWKHSQAGIVCFAVRFFPEGDFLVRNWFTFCAGANDVRQVSIRRQAVLVTRHPSKSEEKVFSSEVGCLHYFPHEFPQLTDVYFYLITIDTNPFLQCYSRRRYHTERT